MKFTHVKASLCAALAACVFLCTTQTQAQQYYKWVDANGSTHYTTTPPPKGAKRLDKIATYGSSVYSTPETQHTNEAQTPQDAAQQAARTAQEATQRANQATEAATQRSVVPSAPPASAVSDR
ncbi:MAG TPA: DUF4124 domain-containing protein [Acinetobacter sp.]|nr:DUF4124 domain-containing protein [Acinetobacter sp.]